MYALGHMHGVHHQGLGGKHRADVMLVVIVHHIVRGDEHGYVSARLGAEVIVNGPVVLGVGSAPCAAQSLVDGTRTAVVGGDGQRPVAVAVVQVLKVFGGLFRRLVGVAAFVNHAVHLQAEALAGAYHELPQAGGAMLAGGVGVQGRLYHGQILKLERKTLGLQRLLEDGHII